MEILGKILGSPARVKIMRLFLVNQSKGFAPKDIASRSRVSQEMTRSEIRVLSGAGFIKKKGDLWYFNHFFKYSSQFENLLIGGEDLNKEELVDTFKKIGKITLFVVAGIFLKNKNSRVDLLLVGNGLKRPKIEEIIRKMEAEMGAELSYAIFDTKEFIYRLNMYDKLVRDILDFPHEVIVEAKDLTTVLAMAKKPNFTPKDL